MSESDNQWQLEACDFIDPLLDCLALITQFHKSPYSREALKSGLPLENNRFTPSLFLRAAERVGFTGRLVKQPFQKISNLLLPAVCLLEDNRACVVTKIDQKNKLIQIVLPENNTGVQEISFREFRDEYTGYTLFVRQKFQFQDRPDDSIETPQKSWFWGTLWQSKSIYTQVLLAAVFVNLFALATPLFIMNVYDRVIPNAALESLWILAAGIGIVFLFDFILRSLRVYLVDVVGKKADIKLSSHLFQRVLGIRMENKPSSAGALASNLREFEVLRDFFTSASLTSLVDLPFLILFIGLVFYIGGNLAIIPLLAIPILLLVNVLIEIPLRKSVTQSHKAATEKQALLVEAVSGLEVVKGLSAEGTLQKRWEHMVVQNASHSLRARMFSAMALNSTLFIQQLITVSVVVSGVFLVISNSLTVGGLIACTILTSRALAPLGQFASMLTRYQQARLAMRALNQLMDQPQERMHKKDFVHRPTLKGDICFNKTSFSYPNQSIKALSDISFSIKSGEKIGILGRNGSGKTTLQKLILNLYQPTDGSIQIDSTDSRQIDPANIRKNIGYIPQDTQLFYGTLRENIVLGAPWVDDDMVIQAAKLSGAEDFINQHPAGYDMQIGEGGAGLSLGQRQMVAVTRGLLNQAPILLMDEPASALDTASEQKFIHNMADFIQNRTLVLISHKKSMLQLVDRLIVLDHGRIVADDTRDNVLRALGQKEIDHDPSRKSA